MGADEENLNTALVPPEDYDRAFTKGEEQPKGCRDVWAALLFYAQAIAVGVFCFWLGVPAVTKQIDSSDQQGNSNGGYNVKYSGIMYLVMSAAGCAFVLSALSLGIMSCCPKILIQFSLLISLLLSLAVCVYAFMYNSILGGVFGAVIFLLSLCYACAVWRRIPFAAANLKTALTATRQNFVVYFVAYAFVFITFAYTFMWMTAVVGIFDANGVIDDTTGDVVEDPMVWLYFFLLLLALFWSEQVFQNTVHAIVAGVVSTWWFDPEQGSGCCSGNVIGSTVRATTSSFGSICFGSLLVAIIQTLRALVEAARADDDVEGCAAFMLCLVDCCLRCLEDILEYFNKFAYIYVGSKNVMTLFKAKGWTVIVNDDLISNVLSLFNLVVGCGVGLFGLLMKDANPEWFTTFTDDYSAQMAAFGFPFLIGLVVSAVTFSVVDSSVNTVIVCFAEGPAEFDQNHPDLSEDMREGWRKVYPEECGF
ncbi:hypothetical protein ACHAWO_004606 [Cyclotella atomus]|uniref:Choline transporter-like protein n=1 Tax=Cyclotella atomus TaxID=382360 RepID=A0ABD3PMU5_9STRA